MEFPLSHHFRWRRQAARVAGFANEKVGTRWMSMLLRKGICCSLALASVIPCATTASPTPFPKYGRSSTRCRRSEAMAGMSSAHGILFTMIRVWPKRTCIRSIKGFQSNRPTPQLMSYLRRLARLPFLLSRVLKPFLTWWWAIWWTFWVRWSDFQGTKLPLN